MDSPFLCAPIVRSTNPQIIRRQARVRADPAPRPRVIMSGRGGVTCHVFNTTHVLPSAVIYDLNILSANCGHASYIQETRTPDSSPLRLVLFSSLLFSALLLLLLTGPTVINVLCTIYFRPEQLDVRYD